MLQLTLNFMALVRDYSTSAALVLLTNKCFEISKDCGEKKDPHPQTQETLPIFHFQLGSSWVKDSDIWGAVAKSLGK